MKRSSFRSFFVCVLLSMQSVQLFASESMKKESEVLHFNFLTLKEAENYLLKNHPEMLSQLAKEESAHQVYLQAWSLWMPSIQVSGGYSSTVGGDFCSSGLGVSQTLFENSTFWDIKLKKIDWIIAKARVSNLKNDLFYKLRLKYYELIVAAQDVKAAEEKVDLLQASYEREKKRSELGETTSFQMNQSRVALSGALAELYQMRSIHKKAFQSLYVALGLSPSIKALSLTLAEETIPVHSIALIRDLLPELEKNQSQINIGEKNLSADNQSSFFSEAIRLKYVDRALLKSPLLEISKALVEKRNIESRAHYGQYLPSVSAAAGYNKTGGFDNEYSASVAISLNWTIFDGFGRERRISQAQFDKIASDHELVQVMHQTKQSILGSFYELEEALQTYVASKLSVKLAEEAMQQASCQREWGVISPFEYREATSLLTNARRDFSRSSMDLIRAYYLLVYNTGEDVSDDYRKIEKEIESFENKSSLP